MNEETMWRLLARKFAGEASKEDIDALNQYLLENPDRAIEVRMIAAYLNSEKKKHLLRLPSS